MSLVALAGFLLPDNLGSRRIGTTALFLASLLGCLFSPAGRGLALLFGTLLGGHAVGLGLSPGALCLLGLLLELQTLVLGFALLRSGLVKQLLLAAGCGFVCCLLLLGHALPLQLDRRFLGCTNPVLLGALVCFAA